MKNIPYQNFSSFILRSPLFSFNFLEPLISGISTPEEKLLEVCRLPAVDEAIFLASPDLHVQMKEWLDGGLKDAKKRERLHYGLMRYILRMATRPTPFGLFAGFSLGKWAGEGHIELPEQSLYERHTRLDMNYLCALAQDLANHPIIKENILYYPNSSIYPVGDQIRYVEYRYRVNARRTHHIVAVDHSEYLQRILEKAANGAYLQELAEILVDEEITISEAREFLEELLNSQVLVNQLEPAITGPEFLDQIMTVLEPIPGIDDIKKIILEIKKALEEIDNNPIGTTVSHYQRIADTLEPLKTSFELKYLFQTDMVKPTLHCTVESSLVDDLLKGFDVMNKLNPKSTTTNLSQFKDNFFERYETREVPLLKALDTEAGIGYKQTAGTGDIAPLVDDLAVGPPPGSNSSELRWNQIQAFLLKKYREAMTDKKYEVEITDKELEPFESDWNDLPDTFSAMVQIVEDKSDTYPKKRILATGFGGSSSGNLLGRFCHADTNTDAFVKEIAQIEKELKPDVLLAEIIHLPESRVGNVLLRPVLRQYEIPYLAKAAVPTTGQIKVQDLMLSVKQNRMVLRSKRLNKEVIPRLTNAHNFSFNALPVYQFLADFQTQNL
ncbi:MAG TPA: lantibiotic dehydratase family protein, partial [Candidatus Deferrimicrobium sp.]|nr:lantibiotic dehydratase family protein [Candidatus Deferrimicrobium sp.]